jgi:hypothetical protein
MNYCHRAIQPIVLALLLSAGRGLAGTPELTPTAAPSADDLTLSNFFSEGWNQPFTLRSSLPDGAPDLPLFHTATNFLVRVTRTDYSFQNDLDKSSVKNVNFLDQYIDYAFNERFMISLFGDYTWLNKKAGADLDGAGGGAAARFQLIDTPTSSDCLNLRVDVPEKDLGVHTTRLSPTFAGWQDLSQMGAKGVGFYYSAEDDIYAGEQTPGTMRNALGYDVALAKTWTKGTAPVADLTTFVEFAGGTNLDGNQRSYTDVSVTPAVQFIVGGHNLVMLGVDFPLTHPSAEVNVYRVTYIYLF